jgi:hypothetical protein
VQVDSLAKQAQERMLFDKCAGEMWILKNRAREIKRAWPDADFNKYPLCLHSWVPAVDSQHPSPWLAMATQWRDALSKLSHVRSFPEEYLNTLDFDEVMELLDDAERVVRKLPILRAQFYNGSPDVKIMGWQPGRNIDGNPCEFGFSVHNFGSAAASNITVSPSVSIGRYALTSDIRVQPLLTAQGNAHLTVWLKSEAGSGVLSSSLPQMLSQLPKHTNGYPANPLLRLVYQDAQGTRYATKHIIESPDGMSVMARFISRELLATQPWTPKWNQMNPQPQKALSAPGAENVTRSGGAEASLAEGQLNQLARIEEMVVSDPGICVIRS